MTLIATDLSCARGGATLLTGVNLRVEPGQALVLRGPNGVGKTTLLRALAGLTPPVSGQVQGAAGAVYAGHLDAVKPTLTVAENLHFWARVFGTGPQAVEPAIQSLELSRLTHSRAMELSAGQKRRLGLARLAVAGPGPWLLDEPTVSLDKNAVALFATLVQEHLSAGGLAVIATHIDLGLPQTREIDLSPFRRRSIAVQIDVFAGKIE